MHSESTSSPLDAARVKQSVTLLLLFAAALALLGYIFFDGLAYMVQIWERDEYSHGYMIPMVALFLVWQKQARLLTYPQPAVGGQYFS